MPGGEYSSDLLQSIVLNPSENFRSIIFGNYAIFNTILKPIQNLTQSSM